jgi:predicted nucleic acid-binding protein
LQQRWRFGFYDSIIVASALSAGCTQLLSEDLQDGQRIEGLVVKNPFAA